MKVLFFAVILAVAYSGREVEYLFQWFIKTYERDYIEGTDKYYERLHIFEKNYQMASDLSLLYPETQYGVTIFSDLSQEEFAQSYLTKPFSGDHCGEGAVKIRNYRARSEVPDDYNWLDHGAVSHVKNQGACGSCWAFSAIGNIEGQWFLGKKDLQLYSEQQLVDCDPQSHGCQGGYMDWAFQYLIDANGIETEADYPYEGINDKCRYTPTKATGNITSYVDLPKDEDQLRDWCYENGPIAVALNAELLQFYIGGIFDPPSIMCNPKNLDHGVLITGWGQKEEIGVLRKFWVVKNSWGGSWGEKGYFKIKRGDGKCGINTCASSAKL